MKKKDKIYQKLIAKMDEVSSLPTQEVGPFTPLYKMIVSQLKFYPWRVTTALSVIIAFLLYLIFGHALVKLASLLQFGF